MPCRFGRVTSRALRGYATQAKPVPSSLSGLPPQVRKFVEEQVALCQPSSVHVCDGSDGENTQMLRVLQQDGMIKPLSKYENW